MAGTAAKALLGLGLLLVLLGLTVLRNPPAEGPHGSLPTPPPSAPAGAAGPPATLGATTTVSLSPFQQAKADRGYLAVEAAVDELRVYDHVPPGSTLTHTFPRKGYLGVPATFWAIDEAVDNQGRTWYRIYLPVRPNGSTGWVRSSDVTTRQLANDLRVDLSDHRLDLYERGVKVRSYPIGVGKGETPSPLGEFYITIKMKPPRPNTVYGVLAMGISGYSEKLTDWPGGGQVGIHGTNDPSSIGKDVSAGCIRLRNEDILELSNFVPLGTPVFIQE
ncbi:MAG: hypothetical protein Kow00122_10410 [Thermoleophilia bacterium]